MLADEPIRNFRETVWDFYHAHARAMPWRDDPSPYHVLVSELMLQQTQVGRVVPKFAQFTRRFPTVAALAAAPLADVLREWNGLGYNRRAKFLHGAARLVMSDFAGHIPDIPDDLRRLPGVGHNTAGAILAYAYNQPVVFIETNIRTVFFHHFFTDANDIDDRELLPLVERALDSEHPREWYWALMDYGAHLKQTAGNNISRSKHYTRQSAFAGSRRQLRGKVLRRLVGGTATAAQLAADEPDKRLASVLDDLMADGLIERTDGRLRLTGAVDLP